MFDPDVDFDAVVPDYDSAFFMLSDQVQENIFHVNGHTSFFIVLLKKNIELQVYEGATYAALFLNILRFLKMYNRTYKPELFNSVNRAYQSNIVTEVVAENSDFADLGLMRISSSVIENKSSKDLTDLYNELFCDQT